MSISRSTLDVTADALAEHIASLCDQFHKTSKGWRACCPVHKDTHPSLDIDPGTDRVLLICRSHNCDWRDILAALMLKPADLFCQPKAYGWDTHIVDVYDYEDESGTVLFQVRRTTRKQFPQFHPDPAAPDGWSKGVQGVRRVLYHLPEVLAAIDRGEPIYLAEGEKDVNNLRKLGVIATCNPMGASKGRKNKKWLPEYNEMLRDATCYLLPDHDTDGAAHVQTVAAHLQDIAKSVRIVPGIHTEVEGSDVSDWLAAGHTRAELEAAVAQAKPYVPPVAPLPEEEHEEEEHEPPDLSDRPHIPLGIDQTRMINEGQQALMALPNGPIVFQRARGLAVIARGVKPPKWLHRPEDMPIMMEMRKHHLNELLGQAAYWMKDFGKGVTGPVLPPAWVAPMLQERPSWPFPLLEGIVNAPTLRPDGSLLTTAGYDPETGLYLDYNGTDFPSVLPAPTIDDARNAIGALQEAVQNFPWTEPHHFSATLAAILSLVCRFAIMGNVPLFAIRATASGSGKGLLADVISIIGTGYPALRWPEVKDDEEERKRLLTIGLAGDLCVHIDNVVKPLGSPALDLALTSPTFTDRILGTNEARTAPLNMVWLASGNNMQFKDDTARRVVPIDLDSKMERPEERTDFTYIPLLPWVQQERPRLTIAALTIMKAFFEAGCLTQAIPRFGSFEAWSDLIRQALVWAGEADPNQGRTAIEGESNPAYEQLAQLLDAWELCYPIPNGRTRSAPKTLKEVLGDIAALKAMDKPPVISGKPNTPNGWDALQDAMGACDGKYDGKTVNMRPLGDAFRQFQGRTIGTRRFQSAGESHRAKRWVIETV